MPAHTEERRRQIRAATEARRRQTRASRLGRCRPGPGTFHGTDGGYCNHGCRGEACRAAHAEAARNRRKR